MFLVRRNPKWLLIRIKMDSKRLIISRTQRKKSDDKNYVAVLVLDTLLTMTTVSDSPQWHGVDSSQALLSEELVTNPLRFVVNKRFVLRWAKGELLRGTNDWNRVTSQSEFEAISWSRRQAHENSRVQVMVGIGFKLLIGFMRESARALLTNHWAKYKRELLSTLKWIQLYFYWSWHSYGNSFINNNSKT